MNIIFDLDGTLIDSQKGIQNSFDFAFEKIYQKKNTIKIQIGPPLEKIVIEFTGEKNVETLRHFIKSFKLYYDSVGYQLSITYYGIEDILNDLVLQGHSLFICTNKRMIPTYLILRHLSIDTHFQRIYCLDSEEIEFQDKSALLNYICVTQSLNNEESIFIGDTELDFDAAKKNNITFIHASWGYGIIKDYFNSISSPKDIIKYLIQKKNG